MTDPIWSQETYADKYRPLRAVTDNTSVGHVPRSSRQDSGQTKLETGVYRWTLPIHSVLECRLILSAANVSGGRNRKLNVSTGVGGRGTGVG